MGKKNKIKKVKEKKSKEYIYILVQALIIGLLFIMATYAWFTTQKNVSIVNLKGKVEVAEGLEVSLDAKKWVHTIDLSDERFSLTKLEGTDGVQYGPYSGHRNHIPKEFIPVSTLGKETNVDNLQMLRGEGKDDSLKEIVVCEEDPNLDVEDEKYAGYFAFDIFLRNLSKMNVIEDTLQLNSDSSAWVLDEENPLVDEKATYKGNPESGLQNTVRIALARYGVGTAEGGESTYIPSDAAQAVVLADKSKITSVSIWEPNSDTHVQNIIDNVKPKFDKLGILGVLTDLKGNQFFTYALNPGVTSVENVYNWADAGSFSMQKTVQTTTNDAKQPYIVEGVTDLTNTYEEPFTLAANSITKIRVYIWIEGQDPDCTRYASYGGGLEINLGLTKLSEEGTFERYEDVMANGREIGEVIETEN